jgi:hypothetical protein
MLIALSFGFLSVLSFGFLVRSGRAGRGWSLASLTAGTVTAEVNWYGLHHDWELARHWVGLAVALGYAACFVCLYAGRVVERRAKGQAGARPV